MVGRDTVTFKFRLDAKEMQRLIKALETDARRMGATMTKVGHDAKTMGDGIKDVGRNSAAAAVNFQTATQGMLNLSTAAVQTFTSVSNLDRAANRLAQSKLGVARSTDLLNNKELRLNELQERGLAGSRKAALLTNEIATARADLAIKTDKARIEEGALLDIQLLFATNIANVMISSIQTIKTMRDMQALSTIRATIAESGLIMKMKGLIFAQRAVSLNAIGTTTAFKGMTIGIKGMTLSVKGLMLALGPIALIIGGVTLAMQAYEENWGGFKDSMQSALPFLKETNSDLDDAAAILENDRIAMEGYTGAVDGLSGSLKQLTIPHRNYLEMMAKAAINLGGNIELAKQYTKQLGEVRQAQAVAGFSQPSFAGGQVGTGFSGTSTSSSATASGVSNAVLSQPTTSIPQITQQPTVSDIISQNVNVASSYNDWYANHASKGISWSQYQSMNQHKSIQDIVFSSAINTQILSQYQSQNKTNEGFAFHQMSPSLGASTYNFTGTSFSVAPHPFGTPQQRNAFNFLPKKERETMALELFNQYQASDDPAVFMMSYQARDLIDSIKNEKSNDIKSPAEEWKAIMTTNPTGFGDVDNRLLSNSEFIKSFKKYTQEEGPNQYRIDLDTPDVLTRRTQRASFTAKVNRLRKIVGEERLKDKLEQVKKGLISPFGMSKGREVAYGGVGGLEILKAVLGNDNLQNRPDSLLNGMVKGMLSNIDLFSSGSVERFETTDYGKYNVSYSQRVGESSIIDTLRNLQVESLLRNDPNAFTKTRTNLGTQTQRQFDAMNREGNVSDMSRFRGQVRTSQTLEVLRRNATTLADNKARNNIKDNNTNRLRQGGTRVEGIPMDEEGAVVGGYSSLREYRRVQKGIAQARDSANQQLGAFFGVGLNYAAIYGKSSARSQQSRLNSTVEGIRSALASAGLSYKTTSARYRRGQGPAQYAAVMAEWASVRSFNASQLSKAAEINTLQQGFGLTGFSGSTMSLPSLQDEVAKQDEMIKTIGLNRTEAFQIIDTAGRGRDEIDARVLWKNRVNNISTGTSVL
jgi:hypothetical protein